MVIMCESHNAELVQAGEIFDAEVALVPLHATLKGFQRHEVHDLGKYKRTCVYISAPSLKYSSGRFTDSAMRFQVEDKHKWHLS